MRASRGGWIPYNQKHKQRWKETLLQKHFLIFKSSCYGLHLYASCKVKFTFWTFHIISGRNLERRVEGSNVCLFLLVTSSNGYFHFIVFVRQMCMFVIKVCKHWLICWRSSPSHDVKWRPSLFLSGTFCLFFRLMTSFFKCNHFICYLALVVGLFWIFVTFSFLFPHM